MIGKVSYYIKQEQLIDDDATVLVGLSGGMDSMALVSVLRTLGYRCIAAHCNFHLRGSESDRDEHFVQQWCDKNDIELVVTHFQTTEYALQNKISIEMAARELRYNWFEEMRQKLNADVIAVAHHKDDSIETVLMNLIRGTGIKGLTGIKPKNGYIVRPLLSVSRTEIERFISENHIPYVTDSTNNEDVYTRNMLRINLLPLLEQINPSAREAIYRTSQNLAEAEKIYDNAVACSLERIYINGHIYIEALKKSMSPKSILFELLSPKGFTPSTIEDVFRAINSESGLTFFSPSHRLVKDRDSFILSPIPESSSTEQTYLIKSNIDEITEPVHIKITHTSKRPQIRPDRKILYVDADKIKFPLTLRRWQKGDWFVPFGMRGKKKVSDYFTDAKFSINDKEKAWIMLSGQDIVWIVGQRNDNRFCITPNSKNFIIFEIVNKES